MLDYPGLVRVSPFRGFFEKLWFCFELLVAYSAVGMHTEKIAVSGQEQTTLVQQLFLTHHNALRGFVFSILPDCSISDDVVQETFLTATSKAADYRPGTNFFAWVCSIARFHVLRARRNNSRAARESFSEELIEVMAASVPDDAFESSQELALGECYERLPRHMREVIRLRYVSGLGPGEIGTLLKRTADSVNATLGKARSLLRQCVQRNLKRQGLA